MKEILQETAQRLLVLMVLLCLFSVLYVVGCAGVVKTALFSEIVDG